MIAESGTLDHKADEGYEALERGATRVRKLQCLADIDNQPIGEPAFQHGRCLHRDGCLVMRRTFAQDAAESQERCALQNRAQ